MPIKLQIWRVFGATLLVVVLALFVATNIYQVTNAYALVNPSPDMGWWVGIMVIATMLLCLMFPQYNAARWSFIALALTLVAAAAINAAPRLGLLELDPLAWRVTMLVFASLPIGFIAWVLWVQVTTRLSKPILALAAPETKTETSIKTETKTETIGETTPKYLGSGNDAVMQRLKITRPRRNQNRPDDDIVEGKIETETADGGGTKTKTKTKTPPDLDFLYRVLATIKLEGKVAEVARQFNLSTTMINNHLRTLHEIDPQSVERDAPGWVQRNIGTPVTAVE